MTHVLALDLGTTGTRSVLFNAAGNMIGYAYEEWGSIHPSPAEVEQDATTWWRATRETILRVLDRTGIHPKDIDAVAVTNQRETIVPVDKSGVPLANAIVWQDRRTTKRECPIIRERLGEDLVYKLTGLTIDPYFSASKILWFKRNRPKVHAATAKYLLVHDFIVHRLIGEFYSDPSNASRTMLYDINRRDWCDEILDGLEIDVDMLPDVIPSGEIIGEIGSETDSGLASGTKVIAGGGDQQCAALGVGVTGEGRVKCTMGTGTFLVAHSDTVQLDPGKRVICSCSVLGRTHVVEASMFSTGSLLRWARDTIGKKECDIAEREDKSPYAIIDDLASKSPAGANGLLFLPFIVGAGAPYWNPDARGTLFGIAAGHGRGDIYRAIMEATSFDVNQNIEVFREMGLQVDELRLTGGGSRSSIWNQILANACNVPCLKPSFEQATAVGVALLAATGAGLYRDIKRAASEFITIDYRFEPSQEIHEIYKDVMARYVKLYKTLVKGNMFGST